MEYNSYVTLFLLNVTFYLLSFFLVYFRINYSSITIRSPKLTIISNISSFILTTSLITYELIENYDNVPDFSFSLCRIIPSGFVILNIMVFSLFFIRLHRIIACIELNELSESQTKTRGKSFYKKKYLIDENYYVKIFGLIFCFFFILGFFRISQKDSVLIPYYFKKCPYGNYLNEARIKAGAIRCMLYLIEGLIAITYIYKVIFSPLIPRIKFEFIIQSLLFILMFHIIRFTNQFTTKGNDKPFHYTTLIHILIHYIFVIFNSYYPVIMTFIVDKIKLSYEFNPKLSSNLYLFLLDEVYYYSFSDFLKHKQCDMFYLNLYTQIMIFKYRHTLEPDYFKILDEAKALYDTFFSSRSNNINYLNENLLAKIRRDCTKLLNQNDCNYEMFDDGLVSADEYLEKRFAKYRKSEEYFILMELLNVSSYVQHGMCIDK